MKRSKKYKDVIKLVDRKKLYSVDEGIELVGKTSYSKFVGSLDVGINFNVPAKLKNEVLRGSLTLPHQMGSSKKIIVIADTKDHKTAKEAGADEIGFEDLIKKIEGGYLDFDILIATPEAMPKMAKLGKILGPKGLMPNPKNDTVTTNLSKAIKSYKAGKMDFRVNEQGSIKARVAKLDMTPEQQKENLLAFLKTTYSETRKLGPQRLKSVTLSATMGPGIKLDTSELLKEF